MAAFGANTVYRVVKIKLKRRLPDGRRKRGVAADVAILLPDVNFLFLSLRKSRVRHQEIPKR